MSFVKVQHSDSHFLSGNLHSLWKNFLLRCAYAFPRSKASSAHFWLLFLASCAMTMSRLFVHSAPPRLFSFSCIDRTARVCWYVVSGEQGRFLRVFSRPLPSSRRPLTRTCVGVLFLRLAHIDCTQWQSRLFASSKSCQRRNKDFCFTAADVVRSGQ